MRDPIFCVLASIPLRLAVFGATAPLAAYSMRAYASADPELRSAVRIQIREPLEQLSDDAIADGLMKELPQLVGLSCYVWNTTRQIRIGSAIKQRNPTTKVVLGGPDVWPRARSLMDRHPHVDAIALGEGEECLRLMLRRMAGLDADDWSTTPGFIVRQGSSLVINPPAPLVDMDRLPSIGSDLEPERFAGVMVIQSARGCRYGCSYCCYRSTVRRSRSLSLIAQDIERLVKLGGGHVELIDAGANQDRERFHALLTAVRQHPEVRLGGVEINLESLDEETMDLLRGMVDSLGIGLQTSDPVVARNVNRAYHPELFQKRVEQLHERGIPFTLDVIHGLPGDTYEGFRRTIDDAYALRPILVIPFRLQVLPGSRLEQEAKRWGLRYNPDPWYYLTSSATFSEEDMMRAGRLADANDLMHTFAMKSAAFQWAARDLDCRPSALLEGFLSGDWRAGSPVTNDELNRWSRVERFDELADNLIAFLHKQYQDRTGAGLPPALVELLLDQLSDGRARSIACMAPPSNGLPWPVDPRAKATCSPNARVLGISCSIDGTTSLHYFVIAQNETEVLQLEVPKEVAELLMADGAMSLGDWLASRQSSVPAGGTPSHRDRQLQHLEILSNAGVIWWRDNQSASKA